MESELVPIEPDPPPPPSPLPDLVAAWEGGKKTSTVAGYRKDLNDFARYFEAPTPGIAVERLLRLNAGEANSAVLGYRNDQLARGLASATIARRLAAIRSVVKLARTLGRVTWTVEISGPKAEPRRDMRGPEPTDLKKVKRSLKAGKGVASRRDRAIVSLLYGLGLRRAEVVGLDLADLDFEGSKILVEGKGRREKTALELPPEVARDVGDWVLVRGRHDGPLFHRVDGDRGHDRLNLGTVNAILAKAGEVAGLAKPLRPHGLRHAAITGLFRREKTLAQVTAFARHKNPQTTLRYHDAIADDAAAMAREVSKDLS